MADNTVLNAGTGGDTIATDDISGIKYQRVKITTGADGTANDVTNANPVPVSDASGSLTVDNAGTFSVQASAVVPGTGATNLGKAEDAAHTSGDVGVLSLGVRQDADTSPVSADGDYHAPIFDSAGNLKVNIKAGAGSGGTALTDAATFTRGSTSVTPAAGVAETSAPTLTNGKAGALSLTTSGSLRVAVTSGAVSSVVEDAASVGGEDGILVLAVRRDTAASSSGTDGDYSTVNTDASGRVWVNASGAAVPITDNAGSLTVDNAGTFAVQAAQSGTWTVQPGNTPNTSAWLTSTRPGTSGGLSISHIVSAGSTNATNIKASAGQVFGWYIYNSNAAARKVAFHNTAGTPTAGASVVFSLVVPPTSGANVFSEVGIAFATGIAVTMVTGLADSDATAVAANDLVCNIFYA